MKRSREPDLRLLCERCGYHLKGLKRTDVCPECGKPVVESLPEKRVGSAWQQRPGWRSWWRTGHALFVHPVRVWNSILIHHVRDANLCALNCAIAGLVPAMPFLIVNPLFGPARAESIVGFLVLTTIYSMLLYYVLTSIEALGVGFISMRRGWRIHRGWRSPILAHASFGWIVGSGLIGIGLVVGAFTNPQSDVVMASLVAPGFMVGLLVFESLVYIGMRRLRFANMPGSERELAPDGDSPAG